MDGYKIFFINETTLNAKGFVLNDETELLPYGNSVRQWNCNLQCTQWLLTFQMDVFIIIIFILFCAYMDVLHVFFNSRNINVAMSNGSVLVFSYCVQC